MLVLGAMATNPLILPVNIVLFDDSYAVEGNEQIGHLPGGNGYSTGG